MKALGLVVSDKKIFENCILKTYFLTPWPTFATNWNGLNNFDRGPPRDHSCEVWSKSNKRFQRRCCLKKLLTHTRTHGRRTLDIEGSQKLTEHFVLRWAKKQHIVSGYSEINMRVWNILVRTIQEYNTCSMEKLKLPSGTQKSKCVCHMTRKKESSFNVKITIIHSELMKPLYKAIIHNSSTNF